MTNLARSRTARWIAAVLAIAVLTGAAYYLGVRAGPQASTEASSTGPVAAMGPLGDPSRGEADDPFAVGAIDAPVTMVMFSDYRCPFCARYSRVTEPELVERYVDSGELRIEWRDFPVFGDASMLAARAGRAAAAQGEFWAFNRAIYEAAPQNGHHDLTTQKLRDFAIQVGVPDLDRFEREMTSDTHEEAIARDAMQARSLGITGTPSFVIAGHPLVGAQPTEVFVQVIDQALRDADR